MVFLGGGKIGFIVLTGFGSTCIIATGWNGTVVVVTQVLHNILVFPGKTRGPNLQRDQEQKVTSVRAQLELLDLAHPKQK